jgi:hypothetical protein
LVWRSIKPGDRKKSAQKSEYLKKLSLDIIKTFIATFSSTTRTENDPWCVSSLAKLTLELSKLTGKNILFYNKTDFDQRLEFLIEISIYRLKSIK